ncbi:MAG: CPBP family intramembrane glutamic endopeptidase [Candidatus Diapherotrites archaeon]
MEALGFLLNFVLLDLFLIGLPILYWKLKKQKIREKLSYQFSFKSILPALALALLLIAVGTGITYFSSFFQANDLQKVTEIIQTWSTVPFLLGYLVIVRPIAEEVFFRAFLVPIVGAPISALLFALAHYGYGSTAEIVGAFVLGLILAFWFQKRKNLAETSGAHILYNAFATISSI